MTEYSSNQQIRLRVDLWTLARSERKKKCAQTANACLLARYLLACTERGGRNDIWSMIRNEKRVLPTRRMGVIAVREMARHRYRQSQFAGLTPASSSTRLGGSGRCSGRGGSGRSRRWRRGRWSSRRRWFPWRARSRVGVAECLSVAVMRGVRAVSGAVRRLLIGHRSPIGRC